VEGPGVGEAICLKFAREGAKVVVNGLPDDPIADVVTTILDGGGDAIPFAGDVAVDEQARRASTPPLPSTDASTFW
jgi:NAD(P)-dependent dehydrogenase (short-subunit alcohol dehydrogenase family)